MSDVVVLGDCRSQGCRDWVRAGRPYADSKPIAQFKATVSGHGFVVYTYPDKGHLTAIRPEDHTPFSGTGWPVPAPRWIGNAADIMPRKAGMGELAQLARQIISDKNAGVPGTEWIKYINWTDEDGSCWHTSWESGHAVTTRSSDRDHIHVSGRSDKVAAVPPHWDPVDRMNGGLAAGEDEDDMGASFGPIDIQPEGVITSLTIPPVQAGIADPRPAWLNFCNDTGQTYGLRIWYTKGDESYAEFPGTDKGQLVLRSGQRWGVEIPAGTGGLSILRQAVDKDGHAVAPTKELPAYAGHLTCAIERGAVKR